VVLTNHKDLSVATRTAVVSPYVADLGVRYMFNNKFGIKADSVNSFTNGDDSKVLILNTTEQITSCCKLGKNHEFRNLD
jgi:hypothetical protein